MGGQEGFSTFNLAQPIGNGADWAPTHVPLLSEVLLDADADPLQSRLPLVRRLVQLALQPLDVLQEVKGVGGTHARSGLHGKTAALLLNVFFFAPRLAMTCSV